MRLVRPERLEAFELEAGAVAIAGGTEVVPQLRDGLLRATTLVDLGAIVPRGVSGSRVGAGTTLAELEASVELPEALREACRLAASPQLRSMSSIGGNLLQSTRCWYWRLDYPCSLRGGDRCHAREGEHGEHAIVGNGLCASAHPSDVAAALVALGATVRTSERELPVTDLYRLPTEDDRSLTTLRHGELLLELDVPAPDASVYLKAMDRKRWSFPIVGVAAVRRGAAATFALAGVAPIPWRVGRAEELEDEATPLPGSAYKLEIARALLARAAATIDAR
jgi:xanthine dehydrogenase YagS FAD-binding subunit